MQKLNNSTLQTFLDNFIEELKSEKENMKLDIPFIISSLYQDFKDNTSKYRAFIKDLNVYPNYNIIVFDSQNDYNGIIDVDINLIKYVNTNTDYYDNNHPDYIYRLSFSYEDRNYGFCECTPDMIDYREDKHCCGHGCDATFCTFSLHKILHIVSGSWDGDEHDYWNFEDEFYISDKELAKEKEKEDIEREITELKIRIEADQKRLAELKVRDEK